MLVDTKPITLFRSLGRLSEKLQQSENYDDILHIARDEIAAMLELSTLWVYLHSGGDHSEYQLLTASGHEEKVEKRILSKLNASNDIFLNEIVTGNELVYVEDARTDPRTNKAMVQAAGNRTILNYPITLYGQTLGFVGAGSFNDEGVKRLPTTEKDYFIALANMLAVAIDRVRLINISNVDHLTGLHNRRSMLECGNIAMTQAKRYHRQVGLIYIDMNNFKATNDIHGHSIGDELLRSFAATLKINLRKSDIVARIGGDEFIIILTELSCPSEMLSIAQHLKSNCKEPAAMRELNLKYHYSLGMASYPQDGDNIEALLDVADKRMYTDKYHKKNGRQKVS